jgi:hypothetical protein
MSRTRLIKIMKESRNGFVSALVFVESLRHGTERSMRIAGVAARRCM